jgi:hypothetical protein
MRGAEPNKLKLWKTLVCEARDVQDKVGCVEQARVLDPYPVNGFHFKASGQFSY